MPDFERTEDWAKRPHVVVVVDESGSMGISRQTTISALNDYLQGLKTTLPTEARVTVVKFDSGYNYLTPNITLGGTIGRLGPVMANNVNISKVFDQALLGDLRPLTLMDYAPRGGTPLNDAIGRIIVELDARLASDPAPVYFTILTDGQENTSTQFTSEQVKSLIMQRKEAGWTVNFMGVEMDAYETGRSYGIGTGDIVELSRATLSAAGAALRSSTTSKFATASSMGFAQYATWNSTDDTFGSEVKKTLETPKE